ncbi:MAG TPA: L-rhamnose mutarotase [Burkholderiaceae bacterium]
MQRMGMVIGIVPDRIGEYRRLHEAVWPAVLERLRASHIRNYTIFLREPENLLFACWDYHGADFAADMAAIAADPATRRWWTFTDPCQQPLPTRTPGEHWAAMERVFHLD